MAGDVDVQQQGTQTLHLREMRRQWQVVTLQMIATLSLILLYLFMTQTYDIIDHTVPLEVLKDVIERESQGGEALPISGGGMAWLTGMDEGQTGDERFFGPILIAFIVGAGFALLAFQPEKVKRYVRLGLLITTIVVLIGEFLLNYVILDLIFTWDWTGSTAAPDKEQLLSLMSPIGLLLEIIIVLFFTLPVVLGARGIWGLRRNAVKWAVVFIILFIGIHAVLTWSIVANLFAGSGLDLTPLSSQVGDPTVLGLLDQQQLDLILISMLLMVFAESAFGVIRYLDYAFRLPESCKRDPEYVRQFYNLLNAHIIHTFTFMVLAATACAIALRFNELLIDMIVPLDNQWSRQAAESLELQLTYGLVISALLFLGFMALLRYLVPWSYVTGLFESANPFRRRV